MIKEYTLKKTNQVHCFGCGERRGWAIAGKVGIVTITKAKRRAPIPCRALFGACILIIA